MSTITAIATPHAAGGISVIRISGERSFTLAEKVFYPYGDKKIEAMSGYTCAYGKIFDGDTKLDDGVLTVFRAPRSYTGEDVVEISCHGGIFITNQVLRAVISAGAVPAEAGEFTKRAFLNGKLTLTQAEAVMDVISSQGEQALKSALAVRDGALFRRIKEISDQLITLLGELGAWVDYPEEDIPAVETGTLIRTLKGSITALDAILSTYDNGKILREGIHTAIIGKPNVGKSTLMNLLSGYERSIVTDIAGTTRDIVEESVRLGDLVLRLSDTAGIRDTQDTVENAGVQLAYKKIEEAQLILAIFDNSREIDDEDKDLIERLSGKKAIALLNKADQAPKLQKEFIANAFENVIEVSAKSGEGVEALQKALESRFALNEFDSSAGVLANERQKLCAQSALSSLCEAVEALEYGETLDAVTVLIDEAAGRLLELTGEKTTEAVVDEVFSHFCVGK